MTSSLAAFKLNMNFPSVALLISNVGFILLPRNSVETFDLFFVFCGFIAGSDCFVLCHELSLFGGAVPSAAFVINAGVGVHPHHSAGFRRPDLPRGRIACGGRRLSCWGAAGGKERLRGGLSS